MGKINPITKAIAIFFGCVLLCICAVYGYRLGGWIATYRLRGAIKQNDIIIKNLEEKRKIQSIEIKAYKDSIRHYAK